MKIGNAAFGTLSGKKKILISINFLGTSLVIHKNPMFAKKSRKSIKEYLFLLSDEGKSL